MSSERDFLMEFLEKYKELTCLWQVTSSDYHDKHKRNSALEELLILMRTKDPNSSKETVQKKINSLRGAFKEFNKVKSSQRSGAGTDEIHIPKLWYYDQMLFLEEQETPRASRTFSSIRHAMPLGDTEETADFEQVPSPQSQTSTVSKHSESSKKIKVNADGVLAKISTNLDEMREKQKKESIWMLLVNMWLNSFERCLPELKKLA